MEYQALGDRPEGGTVGAFLHPTVAGQEAGKTSAWNELTTQIDDLTAASIEFSDAQNEVIGGMQDSIEEVGNLEIALDNIKMSIIKFQEKLEKPIQFGHNA